LRAVLDPNVIVSAVIAPGGAPARVLERGLAGDFEPVASALLLAELADVLARPKLRQRVAVADAEELQQRISERSLLVADPEAAPPLRARDPGDDYLLALAHEQRAALVSGDGDLLELAGRAPVFTPGEFLRMLDDPELRGFGA
jgi:putative PIN family toxin of toxin-antitoxin system